MSALGSMVAVFVVFLAPAPPAKKGEMCGGPAKVACGEKLFCDATACGGGAQGTCTTRPEMCAEIYQPVCGCDGKTYGNDCERQMAGAARDHLGACAPPAPKKGISGQAFLNRAVHCGGAAPRPGEKMTDRSAAGSRQLFIRPGNKNDVTKKATEVTTSPDGSFTVDLPDGEYCIVDLGKKDMPKGGQYTDQSCLQGWVTQCDAVVKAPGSVTVELQQGCFGPCYRGPLPP
jgi:hypothetical protein